MRRAIKDLAGFPDERLLKVVAEGIALIVENATSLDESAARLYLGKDFRASDIIRGFAEEESAKVLILIDFVRCPPIAERRAQTLKHFYGHVAKRIYAMTCSHSRIATFGELCKLVEEESRACYLDGPNWVDWIFPNTISSEREQSLYVDYVQDITDEAGEHWWRTPPVTELGRFGYATSDCVKVSRALSEAGARAPDGLAEIADTWRSFEPEPETDRGELRDLIEGTLDRLAQRGHGNGDEPTFRFICSAWSFPMWPLTITEPRVKRDDLRALREERTHIAGWIEETEAKREPRPAISRSKVETLSNAYARWESDREKERARRRGSGSEGIRFHSSKEVEKWYELPSYARLEKLYRELTGDERTALLALAWYARETVGDWPRTYKRANRAMSTLDKGYQLGLGVYWLAGLERWETQPRPFSAGERRRV